MPDLPPISESVSPTFPGDRCHGHRQDMRINLYDAMIYNLGCHRCGHKSGHVRRQSVEDQADSGLW
eukprot:9489113-Pyramimonas_sp.AAC.1